MMPYLNLFGLALPVAPLTILAGIWFGLSAVEKHAPRYRVDGEKAYGLAFAALVAGLVGARLAFAVQNAGAFAENPLGLFAFSLGLEDPLAGLVVGVLAAVVYGQRKGMELWPTLDALTPGLALFVQAFFIANLAAGNGYGAETNLPWAMDLWGAERHPVQIYEALGAGLITWLLWPNDKHKELQPGVIFLTFAAYTSLARLFFEGFHGDSLTTFFNLRVVQVWAWAALALALWGLQKRRTIQTEEEGAL